MEITLRWPTSYRGDTSYGRFRPLVVVRREPTRDLRPCLSARIEKILAEPVIAKELIAALNVGVLFRIARLNTVQMARHTIQSLGPAH